MDVPGGRHRALAPPLPPRWSRRRWSPLQLGALEPGGWPCYSQGTPVRGRGWPGLVSGEAQGKIRHPWVDGGLYKRPGNTYK